MSEYILEMKHVTKRFPGVIALRDVSISLASGEVLAICGENGAGRMRDFVQEQGRAETA